MTNHSGAERRSAFRSALAALPTQERFLQPPGCIVEIDRLRRVDAGGLLGLAQLQCERWDVPGRPLGVGGI